MNGEKRNAYRILMGKPEGKRPLERPTPKWVGNLNGSYIGWGGMHWIDLFEVRDLWRAVVNTVMKHG
jgi:hypothetical protein